MSTTTQVKKVKINKMSKARYAQTTPVATEFYMLTDVLDPQYESLPTADAKYAGQITQYTGVSVVGGYTNGYFYKCVAQGTTPETYAWEQTDVQPSSGGGSSKIVISLTGESGTLTSAQIAQVLDDTAVLEIVCDGEVFRLSNKDSTLTYRTYINSDCAVDSDMSFKAIYVQLNEEAVNYGSWSLEEVSAGGGSSYTAGEGIDITGGVISVTDPVLKNLAQKANANNLSLLNDSASGSTSGSINIGGYSNVSGLNNIAIGNSSSVPHSFQTRRSNIVIGDGAKVTSAVDYAIQLGYSGTNSDSNTFKVANSNGNFEMMSADGTIPKARLANVATVPSTTPTLTVAGWSNKSQTISVTGVTASNVVFVSPAPSSVSDYAAAGIVCTAQAADSLTFTCETVPTSAIDLSIVIL